MSSKTQALPALDDNPTDSQSAVSPDNTGVGASAPKPVAPPAAAIDPLAPIKAMTEEEKIALFS